MNAIRTTLIAVVIVCLFGACLYYARGSKASDIAEIGQLRKQVEDSQREISELRRLNAETVKQLRIALERLDASKADVGTIRDEIVTSGRLVDESLDDIEYIRETIEGLPVLGNR